MKETNAPGIVQVVSTGTAPLAWMNTGAYAWPSLAVELGIPAELLEGDTRYASTRVNNYFYFLRQFGVAAPAERGEG